MRCSTATLLALPVLATAANVETPLEQGKNLLNSWTSYLSSFIPNANVPHTFDEAAAKAGGARVYPLTLDNWEETLRSKTTPGSSDPAHWYIYFTGGNKTCYGYCQKPEAAFNETAALWALDPTAPHLAYVNCETQPVLCNSWAAGAPALWVFDVRPRPYASDLWTRSINATTTTVETFQEVREQQLFRSKPKYEGYFHPLDGKIAQLGMGKFVGYFFWVFNIVPNWLFMMIISFASRTFITNKAGTRPRPAPSAVRAAQAAQAAAGPQRNAGRAKTGGVSR